MKNTTGQTQIVKNTKTLEILGYILPDESCLLSPELAEKILKFLPIETPENTITA